jgi:hypothetical protein
VVEYLPSKCKALSLNPITGGEKKKKQKTKPLKMDYRPKCLKLST